MAACMSTRLILLVALCIKCSSSYKQCDRWLPDYDDGGYAEENCYQSNSTGVAELGCKAKFRDPVVSWNVNVSDDVVGEMSVDFLLSSNPGSYDIVLEYSDATEETCNKDSAVFKTHSRQYFNVASIDKMELKNKTCGKTEKVWFPYVYTGCYRIQFNHRFGVYTKYYTSCPRFLKTKYVKKLLDKAPLLSTQYNYLHSTLHLTVEMGPELNLMQVNMKLSSGMNHSLGNDVCQKYGVEDVCCSYVPEDLPRCRTSKAHPRNTSCSLDNGALVCTVKEVNPGDYCMLVSIIDDRCEEGTVWMDNSNPYLCRWYLPFQANKTASRPNVVTVSTDNSWPRMVLYWCVVIMFVLILVGIGVACWLCTKHGGEKRKDMKEIFLSLDYSYSSLNRRRLANSQHTTEVLLLYAFDCELFMNLMTVFRNNLKKLGMKVHDCFDPECRERVSRDPSLWMHHLLSRSEVKVIVVSSKCAQRLQQARISGIQLCYDKPRPFSSLFILALDDLLRTGRKNAYERDYHVRFHKFTDESHILAHITPLRMYVLPKHFSMLLQNLTNRCDVADTEVDIEDNNVFDEPLDKLVRYEVQNPHYLDKFLLLCSKHSKVEQHRLAGAQC